MTHDLMKSLLDSIEVNISRVIVSDLQENTYYATIDLKLNGSQHKVDARPSDAIALALRTRSPIFVDEEVMQKAAISDDIEKPETDKEDKIQNLGFELQKAVEDERYEDAARLRDQINEMKEKKKPKGKSKNKKKS
jgi:bifunctional DNase/RNase